MFPMRRRNFNAAFLRMALVNLHVYALALRQLVTPGDDGRLDLLVSIRHNAGLGVELASHMASTWEQRLIHRRRFGAHDFENEGDVGGSMHA